MACTTYLFDEIRVLGEGLLAAGTAVLESAGRDYPGEYYVAAIKLDKGPVIRRDILKMPPSLEQFVFQNVARQIEESSRAALEWEDFEQSMKEAAE